MNILIACGPLYNDNDSGSKAKMDVESILTDNKYSCVYFFNRNSNVIFRILSILKCFCIVPFLLRRGDRIVVEYPYRMGLATILSLYIQTLERLKGIISIVIIYDINSLRYGMDIKNSEVRVLGRFKNVISHNSTMSAWLKYNGCSANIVDLGLFDYISEDAVCNEKRSNAIIIAGNLSRDKSGCYIYKLQPIRGYSYNLYGKKVERELLPPCADYKGVFNPNELLNEMDGKYGLVWDGNSVDTCNGSMGEYLRYNNPHKISLYLAAGKPVIVWSESALAKFVVENGIGFCVNSLQRIEEKLENIDDEEYREMVSNVLKLGNKIRAGGYLIDALSMVE